jgi:hypothetical protein
MTHWRVRVIAVVLALTGALRADAQAGGGTQPPADQLQRAAALFAQSDWSGALAACRAVVAAYPAHGLSRLRVGVSLMELHQLSDAEPNIRAAEKLGAPPPQAAFRLAQLLAEQRRPDEAIVELQRAIRLGLSLTPTALAQDTHLSLLKEHAMWSGILDGLDAVARPCLHDARFREFDFWVGDWDVRPIGQPAVGPAARNTVTLEYNGCVVKEHWVAPGGSEGDTPAPNGQRGRLPTRLTFFHIGRDSVRQFAQVSSDSGRTWATSYDLLYVRRK